jgi:hypothetical protein
MNTKRILFFLFVTLCVAQILSACGTAAPSTPASEPTTTPPAPTATLRPVDPAAIAQSYYKALNDGNLEAAMALVAEDVKCRGGCYFTGKDYLRSTIVGSIDDGWQTELSDLKVDGDKVTYRWEVYNKDGNLSASGVETLHIKDGLITLIE